MSRAVTVTPTCSCWDFCRAPLAARPAVWLGPGGCLRKKAVVCVRVRLSVSRQQEEEGKGQPSRGYGGPDEPRAACS